MDAELTHAACQAALLPEPLHTAPCQSAWTAVPLKSFTPADGEAGKRRAYNRREDQRTADSTTDTIATARPITHPFECCEVMMAPMTTPIATMPTVATSRMSGASSGSRLSRRGIITPGFCDVSALCSRRAARRSSRSASGGRSLLGVVDMNAAYPRIPRPRQSRFLPAEAQSSPALCSRRSAGCRFDRARKALRIQGKLPAVHIGRRERIYGKTSTAGAPGRRPYADAGACVSGVPGCTVESRTKISTRRSGSKRT